jgi:hypothetical protein
MGTTARVWIVSRAADIDIMKYDEFSHLFWPETDEYFVALNPNSKNSLSFDFPRNVFLKNILTILENPRKLEAVGGSNGTFENTALISKISL